MTKQEAKDFLIFFEDAKATDHYQASFPSHIPLPVTNPEYWTKAREAKIVLGIHEFQHTYEEMVGVYPYLTLEKYNSQRKKLGIT